MVGWFEIPVTDIIRAKDFYESVFKVSISVHDMGGLIMGWFPEASPESGASGSLVQHESYIPSDTHGTLVYFVCEDLSDELGRVEASGGEILRPKTAIGGDYGFMGLFRDTEGNRIALHSQK